MAPVDFMPASTSCLRAATVCQLCVASVASYSYFERDPQQHQLFDRWGVMHRGGLGGLARSGPGYTDALFSCNCLVPSVANAT